MAAPKGLSEDQVREFVIAGHGDLEKVKGLLDDSPELLGASYAWSETDQESAIQAAAHVGSAAVAEYLLAQGAPLDICTAAMLGRKEDVERFLNEDPGRINAAGAHGIPVMAHAALSGDVEIVEVLARHGARAGVSLALLNAVSHGYAEIVGWLLENSQPNLSMRDFQGKTALELANERQDETIIRLLKDHGAAE